MAIFNKLSGLNDPIFGKSIAPINMAITAEYEAWEDKSMIPHLFAQKKTKSYAYSALYMTSGANFQDVGELGRAPETDQQTGYQKIITNDKEWKLAKAVSKTMIEDAEAFNPEVWGKSFAQEYGRTREEFAAMFFDNAGSSSGTFQNKSYDLTSADGVAMFSTAHTSKTGGYSNQSNFYNAPFTYDNLFKLEKIMQDFRDDNGRKLSVSPTTILIPNKARIISKVLDAIGSTAGKPETTNHGTNINCGRFTVRTWKYLNGVTGETDDTWFLIDEDRNVEDGLLWLDRSPLEIDNDIDKWSHSMAYIARCRFTAGCNNWRPFIACVPGSASATTLT